MIGEPFLSTGRLVESYTLLVEYMKKCHEKRVNCSSLLPSRELLGEIEELVKSRYLSFIDLINHVGEKLGENIDCRLATEVFKQVYGFEAKCEEAKRVLITQLTAWYLEILETLGRIRIKEAWKP